ncbi:unnamed protein product [Phaedon cochleariae]|uniref:Tectonic-1-3 N-terminal domain-containing protein n=1 Tax=Phaedon cochleariae TaxID=80249 RepID=A0A9P0GUZ5_PHACE|nr:unnamed protein product [Phaedon cochleariae]
MGLMIIILLSTIIVHSQNTQSSEYHSTIDTSTSTSDTSGIDDSIISTTQISDSDGNLTTILPLTTCDINSTSCTTEMLNVTTSKPTLLENKTQIPINTSNRRKALGNIDFCTCDLQLNFCDINCCCDEDCYPEDKLIFDHCQVENRVYDTRYCEYIKYIYINNTPFQWQINQNGLFCVVKSNLAPFYTIQRKHALRSFREAESEKTGLFSWPKCVSSDQDDIMNVTKKFVYGNRIFIIQNRQLKKFQLPNKFITNRCLLMDDVVNLKNVRNTCVQDVIGEDNRYLSMREYYENSYIIASESFNLTKYSRNSFQDCPKNVCLPIAPRICNEHLNDCMNITKNDSRIKVTCNLILNKHSCVNMVKKAQYNFYHNGTNGFSQVILLVYLENISYQFWRRDLEFSQEFSVNFWWMNQTRNYSEILSGNPGYLIGKPILTGLLINIGNKTHELLIIKRNSSRFINNFLIIPGNEGGFCMSTEMAHIVVEFGYNLLTKCKYQRNIVEKKKVNGTDVCRNIQRSVFQLWDVDEKKNVTFGSFGNANTTLPDEWLKILYKKDPSSILDSIFGIYNSKTNLLLCFEIATCLNIDLFHSKIDVGSLHNQEKLLAVTYTFNGFVNKTFFFNKNSSSASFELDLQSRVTFYDISKPKVNKMLDPPSLNIKLPYDFFYPFVKIDNSSVNPAPLMMTLFINIIIIVISNCCL